MIKIRLDVDYPYPSRLKGFVVTALGIKGRLARSKDYLKNSKVLAKMINESPNEVKAYWFFTPYTIPDKELLELLNPERHEVALHVANKPYKELEKLERATGRKLIHYTVHGTERLLGKIIWKRKLSESVVPIPEGFPLKNFYDYPNVSFDVDCYKNTVSKSLELAKSYIEQGLVLHVHPEWLFQKGKYNHRGPIYESLKKILNVDNDLDTLSVNKKGLSKIARNSELKEYLTNFTPSEEFLNKLKDRSIDVFTLVERKWCCPLNVDGKGWAKTKKDIGILKVPPYDNWLQTVGKKTRNMIRKAEKSGIKTEVTELNEQIVKGIWNIYNETPIRQGRAFPHYGLTLQEVDGNSHAAKNCTWITSYLEGEVVGFIQLMHGDNVAVIAQILSLQKYWDRAINNALVAKTVEFCASKQVPWIIYGGMGNHPSLDKFKESNCFSKMTLTRYYVPLTFRGKITTSFGLYKNKKDLVPNSLKGIIIPVYGWVSRTKAKLQKK
jgi:hypothetical protein